MNRYLLALLFLLSLNSCQKILLEPDYREGDFFFLENDKAVMPVWVKGNRASGVFVVYLHGGPGLTSNTYASSPAYKELQERYAFVYWDQRTSGAAQGNPQKEDLSLEQYVEDTEKLITLIKYRYGVEKVFLIGKSWGGCLGTAYLIKTGNQDNIHGWIEIDGAHNLKDGVYLAQDWVRDKAQEKINQGEEVSFWEGEIKWYDSDPEINTSYQMRHGKNLNKLNGIYLDPADDPGNGFPFRSPVPVLYMFNALIVNNNVDLADTWLTPEMYRIQIPSMVLWGRHDGTLPVALAYDAFDNLGTEAGSKELHIFENSAHGCSFEEPDLFVERVSAFIEKYK